VVASGGLGAQSPAAAPAAAKAPAPLGRLFHSPQQRHDPATAALTPGVGDPQVRLKVGQSLDRARGTLSDDLKGGSVAVERAPRGGR
jgi:hypothetical protein